MSKHPFLLFKYSDVSMPEINIQFITSKKRMQKKTAAFSSFSAWTAVFSRVNEWFKRSSQVDTICFDLYLLQYHQSQLTQLSVWLLPAMYKKYEIQVMISWKKHIYSEQSQLKCRIAFSQNIYLCSEFVSIQIEPFFFPKKISSELEILRTGFL